MSRILSFNPFTDANVQKKKKLIVELFNNKRTYT